MPEVSKTTEPMKIEELEKKLQDMKSEAQLKIDESPVTLGEFQRITSALMLGQICIIRQLAEIKNTKKTPWTMYAILILVSAAAIKILIS